MTAFVDLVPQIADHCPGIDDPAAVYALVRSARELCQRTNVWQTTVKMNLTVNITDYTVAVPAQSELNRFMAATARGAGLTPIPTSQVTAPEALISGAEAGRPLCFYTPTPLGATLRVFPPPDATTVDGLVVTLSLAPTRGASDLDDNIAALYQETIVHGALHRLMVNPVTSYTSQQAKYFRDEFERGVIRAMRDALAGRVRSSVNVRPRGFV